MWIISLRKSLGILSVLLLSSAMSWAGPKPQEVFKDAYYQEVHEGDLAGAVKLYEKVIADGKTPSDVLAEARSRLACCREDLRAEDPPSLMPPNVIGYLELNEPGRHLEQLIKMVATVGNPLEGIGGKAIPVPGEPGLVLPRKLVVSSALLSQVKQFKSVAVAVTDINLETEVPSGVVIFHPGDVNNLRGLIETGAQFIAADDPINGFPVIRIKEDGFQAVIAFTARLVVAGSDRGLVEGVINRLQNKDKNSLAENEVFTTNTADSKSAMVYAFVDAQNALKIAYRVAQQEPNGIQDLMAAQAFLDLAHMNSISLALGTSGDGLQGEFVLDMKPGQTNMAYNLLRTPPMRGRVLKMVPSSAAAVLALGVNPESTEAGAQDVITKAQTVQAVTGMDIGREIFANIQEVAVFAMTPVVKGGEVKSSETAVDAGLVMSVGDPDKSEALWQYLLSLPVKAIGQPDMKPETVKIAGLDVQTFPIQPDQKVYLARTDHTILVGLTPRVISEALATINGNTNILSDKAMSEAFNQLGDKTSVALIGHLGRLAMVAGSQGSAQDAMISGIVAEAADKTTLTVCFDESETNFRIRGKLLGLPRIDRIISGLSEKGMLGVH